MNAEEVRILKGAFRRERRKRPCVAMLTAEDNVRTVTDNKAVIESIDGNSVTVSFSQPIPILDIVDFNRISLLLMDGLIGKNVCSGHITEITPNRDSLRFSTADIEVLLQDKDAIKPSKRRKKKKADKAAGDDTAETKKKDLKKEGGK